MSNCTKDNCEDCRMPYEPCSCSCHTPVTDTPTEKFPPGANFYYRIDPNAKKLDDDYTPTEWEDIKGRIAQDILGKLEHRGFYDAGKYLDNDIIEAVKPYFDSAVAHAVEAERERIRELVGNAIEDYFSGLIHIPHPPATKNSLKEYVLALLTKGE